MSLFRRVFVHRRGDGGERVSVWRNPPLIVAACVVAVFAVLILDVVTPQRGLSVAAAALLVFLSRLFGVRRFEIAPGHEVTVLYDGDRRRRRALPAGSSFVLSQRPGPGFCVLRVCRGVEEEVLLRGVREEEARLLIARLAGEA